MKAALLSLVVAVALTGCFASKPPHNVGFGTAHSLRDLEGTYRNFAESDPEHPEFLSRVIWPGLELSQHQAIRTIAVRAEGDTALTVLARDSSGVAKQQTFVVGRDFEFSGGRLRLKTLWENSLNSSEAGGLFVAQTTRELGIDMKGQGKLKKRDTVAGAAYLVVPVAVSTSEEFRFIRVEGP